MKIKFYAHASFRLEGQDLTIITDPYMPGPQGAGYEPINEQAHVVIRSSDDDRFHNDPSHITGDPIVITATEGDAMAHGLKIKTFPVMENLEHEYIGGRDALDNAMYLFELDGIRFLHIGDIGHAFTEDKLNGLRDQVDVMFALTGEHATIGLDDLEVAINEIGPKIVIPMHFWHERGVLNIEPVSKFVDRHPAKQVTWVGGSELEVTPDMLPSEPYHVYVLEQAR